MTRQLQCDVMVGVSTEQNTTNLVPFMQFSGHHLLLAETKEAESTGWSNGPEHVVREIREKDFSRVSLADGDDLKLMTAALEDKVKNWKSVCWNFGGGQKMQQLALFGLFSQRLRAGYKDWACYSEPKSRSTLVIKAGKDGSLENLRLATDAYLTLEEILRTFGNRPKKGSGQCLWNRFAPQPENEASKILLTEEQALWFEDYTKRQRMFEHHDLNETPSPADDPIYPDGSQKLGDYFEKVVQYHVTKHISDTSEQHCINEVWANVRVFPRNENDERAEYDVVLVTNFGTIIPLDAKSYEFSKKDEDSRLHNLGKVSGRYTTIWSIFPFFQADLAPHSILQQHKGWKKLLNRPFELKERHSSTLVMSEKGVSSFSVHRGPKDRVDLGMQDRRKTVDIYTLDSILDQLKIRRQS